MLTLTTPGPSPWYLHQPEARISTPEGQWHWKFFEGPTLAGLSSLQSPRNDIVLFVDIYCYVQQLPDARLLIWYESGRHAAPWIPRIHFVLVNLRALEAIVDPSFVAKDVKEQKQHVRFDGGDPVFLEFATTLDPGVHKISAPAEYHQLAETLVVADYGSAARSTRRAIFAFDFKSDHVTVLPQHWFNEGNYDFGYQWISRVQRDPSTGRIVGEGVRLPPFRLDETGTRLDQ